MDRDGRVVLLTADLGYGLWNEVQARFPARFHNVGAAEQAMVGMAVGLALAGKVPVCYSITPFLLYRPFELIRNYLSGERVPVKLVGSGRDLDYRHDGPTHWATDDRVMLAAFPNIAAWWPEDNNALAVAADAFLHCDGPAYLNLNR
jgi:transketolase